MKSLGVIDEQRLGLIPPRLWTAHEFCFFLHDRLVNLLIEYEASGAQNIVIESFQNAISGREKEFEGLDILKFLKNNNLVEPYKHHIFSHVVMGLTSDMLHFLYESLRCFEKHKISVAFSLLRKPLKEHLFFLAWLLADEDDFISRFEADNYKSLNSISKEKQITVLKKAISKLVTSDSFDAETIWDMIYSKNHPTGFEPTWQRATHLVTSYGDLLKTEDYSLNFIFENTFDGYYHEFLYAKLPYLLIFSTQILFECFNRISAINERTVSYYILTTMGCYEALFLDGRKQHVTHMLKKQLFEFLKCIHCDANLRINKKSAPIFYLNEQVKCQKCGLVSEFPLYWILARAKFTLVGDQNG
jgi:hypothetical protein